MSHRNTHKPSYAEKASFAHVLCTTSTANGEIGTSAEPIFDSDHSSVVFSSNVSDVTASTSSGRLSSDGFLGPVVSSGFAVDTTS